jgi:hypothetical protein
MSEFLHLRTLTVVLIFLVFLYTLHLVRVNKLSAHLVMSWVVTEIIFFILSISDWLLTYIRSLLGVESSILAPSLFGLMWLAFLTLDSLTRISLMSTKLKDVNQELALVKNQVESMQQKSGRPVS